MKKLSERQERILHFTKGFIEEQGYPPTVRDIQYACGISSTSVVDYNLNILQREGYIRRSPDISRGIEVLDGSSRRSRTIQIPVLAYIAAGQPLPVFSAEERSDSEPLEMLELAASQLKGDRDVYALRVHGLSMIDALIADGDVVVIKPTSNVQNGDTVVARLKNENEVTLKRYYHEGTRVRLQPANATMEPIFTTPENLEIQGRVLTTIGNRG